VGKYQTVMCMGLESLGTYEAGPGSPRPSQGSLGWHAGWVGWAKALFPSRSKNRPEVVEYNIEVNYNKLE